MNFTAHCTRLIKGVIPRQCFCMRFTTLHGHLEKKDSYLKLNRITKEKKKKTHYYIMLPA